MVRLRDVIDEKALRWRVVNDPGNGEHGSPSWVYERLGRVLRRQGDETGAAAAFAEAARLKAEQRNCIPVLKKLIAENICAGVAKDESLHCRLCARLCALYRDERPI